MDKYALIDISSTEVRMVLIKIKDKSYSSPYDFYSQPVSIGKDILQDGLIKQSTITDVISIVKKFEQTASKNGVLKTTVVVYDFIEAAKNVTSFFDYFFSNTGFVLHLIKDNDEANAIFSSVVSSVDLPKGLICCVTDTNAYLINYTKKCILNYKKFSLSEMYSDGMSREKIYNSIIDEIKKIDFLKEIDEELSVVACGPAFRTIGKIARKVLKYPIEIEHMFSLSAIDFKTTKNCINSLSEDKLVKIKGISESSTKYLLTDLTIIDALVDGLKMQDFVVSANGIREGLVDNLIVKPVTDKPVFDVLTNSIDNIRAFYDLEMEQSDLVYKFALLLFKQLKVVHKLHRGYVRPLKVASCLYNCGNLVNYKNSPKYTFDIITNSNLFGLTQREVILSGFVCQCQNQDNFSLSEWMKYQSLFIETDLEAVKKLGTLVRLAACLAKYKTDKIKDLECDILGDAVIMKTITDAPVTFEILEGKKVCSDFKKVFKKTLEII